MFCWGCGGAGGSAQDAMTSQIEKVIEAKTGEKVELGNAHSYANNYGSIVFAFDHKTLLGKEVKMQAVAIFQKDRDGLAISFQLTGEAGRSFVAIVNHIPENFSVPLTARFAVSNKYDGINPVATLMYMEVGENAMVNSPMLFEGTFTITKLTEKEMTFEVNAKGGTPADAESPSAWKLITSSGVLSWPIIQTMGIDKKDVLK